MKKEYTQPSFDLFEFTLSDNLLADGDENAVAIIGASGETPIPDYNEDVDI